MGATLDVVVGAQFGSEGKGHVTAQVVKRRLAEGRAVLNIRVAGPNAGHSAVDTTTGTKWALRQVPVGWTAAEQGQVATAIAPGSEIDPEVLIGELNDTGQPVIVDPEATLIDGTDKLVEERGRLVARIGSTGKGIGAARAERALRRAMRLKDSAGVVKAIEQAGGTVAPLAPAIQAFTKDDGAVVIEGTQGFGLGLHAGFYPYCTSSDCRASDFLAMADIAPWHGWELAVWLVARVYPIRVAGNSGPMHAETTWEALGLPEEKTTVTQKVRRVGHWDPMLVGLAARANGGPSAAVKPVITMLDQLFRGHAGLDGGPEVDLGVAARRWLEERAHDFGQPIELVTTSDRTAVWLR